MAREVYCCCDLPDGDGAMAEPPEKKFSFSWVGGVGPPNEICEPPPGGYVRVTGGERGGAGVVSVATAAAQCARVTREVRSNGGSCTIMFVDGRK